MTASFGVVDIFAGPGGLAEGFSALQVNGSRPFDIQLSVEKDRSAHATLRMRGFLRQFGGTYPQEYYSWMNGEISEPDWAVLFPREWIAAGGEALNLTLGSAGTASIIDEHLVRIRSEFGDNTILVGGPPCQAYSLVGRARNRGVNGYVAEEDPRHFLYQEYIRILQALRPAAFVMENVKGMLSSSVNGSRIFDQVLTDLRSAGGNDAYELFALAPGGAYRRAGTRAKASDFLIRAEDFGVPQARHRVIVVGLRQELAAKLSSDSHPRLKQRTRKVTVADVIGGMAKLRSGVGGSKDNGLFWRQSVKRAAKLVLDGESHLPSQLESAFRELVSKLSAEALDGAELPRAAAFPNELGQLCPEDLSGWLRDPALSSLANNETRSHMESDLARYLFASAYASVTGISPKARQFPERLAPKHHNWTSGKFSDRFKVQLWDQPSSTVTCHISKDGHYYIHPDPAQCRSLTVREAARLQTFPDNYLFCGNRTEQFVQVGNAVPPFLAFQIAKALWSALEASASDQPQEEIPSSQFADAE
jgi:DNA (cytosine-5)-methyltransferase 1